MALTGGARGRVFVMGFAFERGEMKCHGCMHSVELETIAAEDINDSQFEEKGRPVMHGWVGVSEVDRTALTLVVTALAVDAVDEDEEYEFDVVFDKPGSRDCSRLTATSRRPITWAACRSIRIIGPYDMLQYSINSASRFHRYVGS